MGFKDNGEEQENSASWKNRGQPAFFSIHAPSQKNKYGGIRHSKDRACLGVDYLVVGYGSQN